MKLCRYFPAYCMMAALVFGLAGLAIADARAEIPPPEIRIVKCLKSTTVVEVVAETTMYCPGCPICPKVASCPVGFSCQKEKIPPDGAEAWVQQITGGELTHILANDPRWGDSWDDQVYARENEDFIVWWWPGPGSATFDPTKLGSPAKWLDYRLSTGSSSTGTLDLSAGMKIQFNDAGGGVSIFERTEG